MATYCDEQLAFLRSIIDKPDDDVRRLAYADWLDEHDEPARAELIRVQCELSDFVCDTPSIGAVIEGKPAPCYMCRPRNKKDCLPWCSGCCRREGAMNRKRELLTTHTDRWRTGPVCGKCGGKGWSHAQYGDCHLCHTTGDAGGLMRTIRLPRVNMGQANVLYGPRTVDYIRGMKRVHATLAECIGSRAGVAGRREEGAFVDIPSDWFRSVLTHHPDVVEVWLDLPFDGDGARYSWLKSSLPDGIFKEVEGHDGKTADAARTALARAVVRWGLSFL